MIRIRRRVSACALSVALLSVVGCQAEAGDGIGEDGEWTPPREITMVIGYAPGGGTDTVARAIGDAISEETGWTISYDNKPGNSGALATEYVDNRDPDGLTWLAVSNYNRFLRPWDYYESVPYEDVQFFRVSTTYMSISVREDSPFEDFSDLIAAAEADPGSVTMSNAGIGNTWHAGAVLLEDRAGVTFDHVPYDGGAEAALAAIQGEVDVVTSGLHEQVDQLQAGTLRNLALFTDEPTEVDALPELDALQPVTDTVPEAAADLPFGGGTSIGLPRDTPAEIVEAFEEAMIQAMATDSFREAMEANVISPQLRTGTLADEAAALDEVQEFWLLRNLDMPGNAPEDFDIPETDEFEAWWPPEEYEESVLGEGSSADSWDEVEELAESSADE